MGHIVPHVRRRTAIEAVWRASAATALAGGVSLIGVPDERLGWRTVHLGSGSSAGLIPAAVAAEEDDALVGVQATLDRQSDALSRADRDAYMATIDQRNLTWRRIQGDVFTTHASRGPRPAARYTVTRVMAKLSGYVKAWLDISPPGSTAVVGQAVWVFRRVGEAWLHSEVLNEEIGLRKVLETEHFGLSYFGWDDDVIERIATTAEAAHARVQVRTGLAPSGRTVLSVNPTYGSHSALRGFGTWALFLPGTDQILIRSIESYGAGTTAPGETQENRLLGALTHEYAHLVNNGIVPTVKMPKWMVEGFAEFVSENWRLGSLLAALRDGRTLTLDRASEIIEWGTDPGRGFSDVDIDLAYAFAAQGTAYFIEQFGQNTFFDLARTFGDSRYWDESVLATTGTSWEKIEAAWPEWTRRRYGL
jgi:hypothetical protein